MLPDLKGDDINYQGWDEDKTEYKTLIERNFFGMHLPLNAKAGRTQIYKPPQSPFMKGGRRCSLPFIKGS